MASTRIRTRKDGSSYTAVLYVHDHKQTSTSFDDHREALKFRDLINQVGVARALEVYRVEKVHIPGMTVGEWVDHHVKHLTGVEAGTIRRYEAYNRRDLQPLRAIPLEALTRDDVAQWMQALQEPDKDGDTPAGKTIKNKVTYLSGALNAAVKAGKIPTNPCTGMRMPRSDRAEKICLEPDEFNRLLRAITPHWRPLVEFLVATGCRFGEAAALKPADVNRAEGTVRISRAWKETGGNGHKLGVPKSKMSRRTINVPHHVLEKLDYSHEWLFVNRDGGPVRIQGFHRRVWAPALKRAGLERKPTPHDLRHTCASWMIQRGVPLPVVQQHLGHESIKTTVDTYGHIDRVSAAMAAEAIGSVLGAVR